MADASIDASIGREGEVASHQALDDNSTEHVHGALEQHPANLHHVQGAHATVATGSLDQIDSRQEQARTHAADTSQTQTSSIPDRPAERGHVKRGTARASSLDPVRTDEVAISHLDLTSIANVYPARLPSSGNASDRPQLRQALSDASTASASTVRPSDLMSLTGAAPTRSQSVHPPFPNQAYSALHDQLHPTAYTPRQSRARDINSVTNALHPSSSLKRGELMSSPTDSRTAGNSPSGSPSLYTPGSSPHRPRSSHDEQHGLYSSPFLHHTQRHAPKETHKADVDVDPISGRKIINQYEIIDELGRGVHGKVKLARSLLDGEHVAIKIVQRYSGKKRLGRNNSHEDKIKREIAILKKARHENIVSLIEVIDDPSWRKVYIVLEFVELGEVAWRTTGNDDICLIEYRRHLREVNNMLHDGAIDEEERRIIAEARQRRERERRRELSRRKNAGHGAASVEDSSWSLELHGDDTDDDGVSSSHSHRSSHSSRNQHSPSSEARVEATEEEQDEQTRLSESNTGEESTTVVESNDHAAGLASDSTSNSAHNRENDDLATLTATGLEGTTFGSLDDITRQMTSGDGSNIDLAHLERLNIFDVPEHFKHVPLLTIEQAKTVFRDTVLGLEYLHYQGVIHRDIKPANLLQTSDHRIKISDFGVSYLGRGKSESANPDASESEVPDAEEAIELAKTVGTPAFYAPELCQTDYDEVLPPVTQQIDVWALGVTLFCLIFGRVPFHDNNPFALMRKIAEDPVHIPRQRLRAADRSSASRPSSRSRSYNYLSSGKRHPYELEYEDVGDDVRDLLRKLLIKDSRERAKLWEIKHHPWVLTGLANPVIWLEETDPHKRGSNRIEVTKEDIADAVVPISAVERLQSGIRNFGKSLGEKLGIGRSSSTRSRAKSSATNPDASNPPSAASSSSTISQDARAASSKIDETLAALRRRDPEHPLAQSQTASPEQGPFSQDLRGQLDHSDADSESYAGNSTGTPARPPFDRAASSSATTKTIRQIDVAHSLGLEDSPSGVATFPALPSTPRYDEETSHASFGGILTGPAKRIFNHMRSRDKSADKHSQGRGKLSDKGSQDSLAESSADAHADPSTSISRAFAAGLFRHRGPSRSQPSSGAASQASSRAASAQSQDRTAIKYKLPSRQGSISSVGSSSQRPLTASTSAHNNQPPSIQSQNDVERAREQSFRRRLEEVRPSSSLQSRPRSATQDACPPSPDDEIFLRQLQQEQTQRPVSIQAAVVGSADLSRSPPQRVGIELSSDDDHLPSGLSQSTSHPSNPSVVSTDPSVIPERDESLEMDLAQSKEVTTDPHSDSSTINSISQAAAHDVDLDEGYVGDNAVESDDGDSDSDDSVLEIDVRKGLNRRSTAVSGDEPSDSSQVRNRARRTTSIKKSRSTSGGSVRKVPSLSKADDPSLHLAEHAEPVASAVSSAAGGVKLPPP